ncbi:MAG: precorrin-6y C5,15-methyltransferase (decarboxylating) subunit CbiE, partial [Dehalococcoidales bacterium]|nr:precorrin-6y C5,15-methyltransferase (decarboxylating) subunit CbiE [Dehalococcoidales bacterium]
MRRDRVYIIGVAPEGAAGLSASARRMAQSADLVIGGDRLLNMFPSIKTEKVVINNDLDGIVCRINAEMGKKRIVVLASGDPGFFGIGRHLTESLGRQRVEIMPNVSSMQLAFARIKESWADAALVS